jgi:hypothetical protein
MSNCCCSSNNSCSCSNDIFNTSTILTLKDTLGACAVRFGIGRKNYRVEPGLYSVGKPDKTSPVLVSANYKLTFDTLRKNLCGLDCWFLILDTKGINVWCAAGKGTFGTCELVNRIESVCLTDIVEHKRLIVPQLGAPVICSRDVLNRTGFLVSFGPVRARDIKEYISLGCKATKEMRTVKFTMLDRLILTPMEITEAVKKSLIVFGVLFLINLFTAHRFDIADFLVYGAAVFAGTFLTPVLLPFIPGRAFAFKGWLMGVICIAGIVNAFGWFSPPFLLLGIGYMLALPAYSSFLAMNFTGVSTYTSFSGVIKEMKIALPFIILSFLTGVVLILIKKIGG